jgi:hypothetical protein
MVVKSPVKAILLDNNLTSYTSHEITHSDNKAGFDHSIEINQTSVT